MAGVAVRSGEEGVIVTGGTLVVDGTMKTERYLYWPLWNEIGLGLHKRVLF